MTTNDAARLPGGVNDAALPRFRGGSPTFTKLIAHLCFHRVREELPFSAPDFPALLEHLRNLAAFGYNAVCFEPETMLPLRSAPTIATGLTWSDEQVRRFRSVCDELGLEIIPLLQSLGHAYAVLQQPEFAQLRESPGSFQQYCPSEPASRAAFFAQIDDVRAWFPDARRLHIGGDECRQLGRCPRCASTVKQHGVGRLYGDHISAVAAGARERGFAPLIWSDMLEQHPEAMATLPDDIGIIYWNYQPDAWLRPPALERLVASGRPIIGASAIRWGQHVSDIAPPYHQVLDGISALTADLRRHRVPEHMVTDWCKGTCWELSDWGWFFAAAVAHDPTPDHREIARDYAAWRFGLADGKITGVHRLLSVFVPLSESPQMLARDFLNRFDLTGSPYDERRMKYREPERVAEARAQAEIAGAQAREALEILWGVEPSIRRGRRHWELLEHAARELEARAEAAAIALSAETASSGRCELDWARGMRVRGLRARLAARRERSVELFCASSHPSSALAVARTRYTEAEESWLLREQRRVTGGAEADTGDDAPVLPFLDNPGPAFVRGLEHGRVFGPALRRLIAPWLDRKNEPSLMRSRDRMESYLLRHFPWMIDEMRGIARGASLTFETVLWLNVFNAVSVGPAEAACSTAIMRRGTYAAMLKTSDIDQFERRMHVVQRLEGKGRTALVGGWMGTLWGEYGVNSGGLAVGINSGPRPAPSMDDGLPQHMACYAILAECSNVAETIEFLRRHPLAGKGLNLGCIDAAGNGAVIEAAAGRIEVRRSDEPFLAATNHFLSPTLSAFNSARTPPSLEESTARLRRIEEFLAGCSLEPAAAMRALGDIAEGEGRICKTLVPEPINGTTLGAAILLPCERSMWVTGLPPVRGGWALLRLEQEQQGAVCAEAAG
jgi:predicted choloylglycine hydrolase